MFIFLLFFDLVLPEYENNENNYGPQMGLILSISKYETVAI